MNGDSVIVAERVKVHGNVDIYGTLFSRSGVETKSLTIDENLMAYGSGIFGNNIFVNGAAQMRNGLDGSGNLTIYKTNSEELIFGPTQFPAQSATLYLYTLVSGEECDPNVTTTGCLATYPGCRFVSKGLLDDVITFTADASSGLITTKGGINATSSTATFSNQSHYDGTTTLNQGGAMTVKGNSHLHSMALSSLSNNYFYTETEFTGP